MNDLRKAAEQALEALQDTCDHLPARSGVERDVDEAITALQVALAPEVTTEVTREVPCKTDPRAPHGFDRNASHSADRYVCECEGWEPVDNAYTKLDTTAGVLHKKWRGLQDKDLHFLWVSTAVKKINKDRYTLIARQIETYLKERNTHEI